MANNIFTDKLNNIELMDAFGINQENAPLTPEELATLSQTQPQLQKQTAKIEGTIQPVINQASPKKEEDLIENKNLPPVEPPMSRSEALISEYNKLLGKGETDLADARKRDRMLKIGGSIGDALATYLNAKSQMNVKAPGVQVQQGAGLGKVADMFATAPEIASDQAQRREALMNQYKQLSMEEMSKAKRDSAAKIAEDRNKTILEAANIKAAGGGTEKPLTPYQQYMIGKSEKKEAKLSDKQTAELEGLGNVLKSLDEVESAKSGVNTGRYASAYQSAKDIIPGIETDQDFVKLRQLSGTQLFDYVKAQSGVSYSVKELQQLKNNMPNEDDDDNTFMTKLNTVRDIVKRKQQEKLKAFENQGKDVSGFKDGTLEEIPSKDTSTAQPPYGEFYEKDGKKYRWNPRVNKYQLSE